MNGGREGSDGREGGGLGKEGGHRERGWNLSIELDGIMTRV